jgi:cell division protein FtsB
MGLGSAGTPPWVDEKAIDAEKHQKGDSEQTAKIKTLEKDNANLKKRVKELETELKKLKK